MWIAFLYKRVHWYTLMYLYNCIHDTGGCTPFINPGIIKVVHFWWLHIDII